MSVLFVGTSYNQIYQVPITTPESMSQTQPPPIKKYGQKKRSPVVSISFAEENEDEQENPCIFYANSEESYGVWLQQNQILQRQRITWAQGEKPVESEQKSKNKCSNQKIIGYSRMYDQNFYFTSHGNVYNNNASLLSNKQQNTEQTGMHKLFFNQIYNKTMASLPPQRAGRLLPQYTRAIINFDTPNQNQLNSRIKTSHTPFINNKFDIGFVGRGVLPFVYSYQQKVVIWQGKNVSNDELDLEVPINDVDLCFLNKGYHMACANAQAKIRLYDIKSRRKKPISDTPLVQIWSTQKYPITRMVKSPCQAYLYISNSIGSIFELDIRKNFQVSHKFKTKPQIPQTSCKSSSGPLSTVKDMLAWGNYIAAGSLDGFLRIYDVKSRETIFEQYLNVGIQKLSFGASGICLILQKDQQNQKQKQQANRQLKKKSKKHKKVYQQQEINLKGTDLDAEEQVQKGRQIIKMKKIRKRNKVGLKYLQVDPNLIKLQHKQQKQEQQNDGKNEEEADSQMNQQYNKGYQDEDLDL